MPNWVIFVLLFSIFVSLSSILSRYILSKKSNVMGFVFLHNIAGAVAILPLLYFDFRLPTEIMPWIFLLFGTTSGLLGDYYYFLSLKEEETSVLSLVFRMRLVYTFIAGILIFGEKVSGLDVLAMLFVLFGAIIVNYKNGQIKFSKGVILANISNIFLTILLIMDKQVSGSISVPLYSFLNFASSGIFFGIIYFKDKRNNPNIFITEKSRWLIALAGVFLAIGTTFRRFALVDGDLSMVSILMNLSVVLTVVMGIVILKERTQLPQKILGLIILLAGVAMLYW